MLCRAVTWRLLGDQLPLPPSPLPLDVHGSFRLRRVTGPTITSSLAGPFFSRMEGTPFARVQDARVGSSVTFADSRTRSCCAVTRRRDTRPSVEVTLLTNGATRKNFAI